MIILFILGLSFIIAILGAILFITREQLSIGFVWPSHLVAAAGLIVVCFAGMFFCTTDSAKRLFIGLDEPVMCSGGTVNYVDFQLESIFQKSRTIIKTDRASFIINGKVPIIMGSKLSVEIFRKYDNVYLLTADRRHRSRVVSGTTEDYLALANSNQNHE